MPTTPHAPDDERILDVRPAEDFQRRHRAGAVNIPLEELADRIHELPPRTTAVTLYDADERRARWARSRLRVRDRLVARVIYGDDWLQTGPTAQGPSHSRLWQPHALLIEAVEHARQAWGGVADRRALDIACGSGRDAVFLALTGFQTEAWDVLPDAVALCDDLARRHHVSVTTRQRDVEADPTIETACYDLVACFSFLHRPLMPHIAAAVRPGGFVVYETFVHPQRELFGKPRRDAHLLESAELPAWFEGWQIKTSNEGLTAPRRFTASLIARKPNAE